jgi:hypothetical protein
VLIVTTATLSLILIGLLALSMTPGRGAGPLAVEATTATTGRLAALEQPALPMVTPIGDEGWAVTTSGAAGSGAVTMAARLPSGDVVDVEIVRRDAESGVTLVSLPALTHGYQLATASPAPSDTVVVHGAPPQIVAMVDVTGLDLAEGTPVLDEDGDLVGICTRVARGVVVMTVSTMPASPVATSTTGPPAATTVTTGTAVTVTTLAPSTTGAWTTTSAPTTIATSTLPATSSTVPSTVTTVPATAPVTGVGAATTAPG